MSQKKWVTKNAYAIRQILIRSFEEYKGYQHEKYPFAVTGKWSKRCSIAFPRPPFSQQNLPIYLVKS